MTTRRFTRAVTSAARAGEPERTEEYERMRPGDEFQVQGKPGRWRFRATVATTSATWVEAYGPLIGRPGNNTGRPKAPGVRSFDPAAVVVPSQRMLNSQRRRRAAEQEEAS